jgi:cell division protein FtsB
MVSIQNDLKSQQTQLKSLSKENQALTTHYQKVKAQLGVTDSAQ